MPTNKSQDILDLLRLSEDEIETYLKRTVNELEFTDFSAKLNALTDKLGKLNDSAKGVIKSKLLEERRTISEGHNYLAVLHIYDSNRLDTDKIKSFLGKQLNKFLNTTREQRLTFKVKG